MVRVTGFRMLTLTSLGIGISASPDFAQFFIPITLGMYFPANPSGDSFFGIIASQGFLASLLENNHCPCHLDNVLHVVFIVRVQFLQRSNLVAGIGIDRANSHRSPL